MKRFCVAILIVILLLAVAPGVASAQDAAHNYTYKPQSGRYTLNTITKDGKPMGVRFGGFYFGASGITVTAELYSSPQKPLDFCIGDADYSSTVDEANQGKAMLTSEQTEERKQLVAMFNKISDFIDEVDRVANTQYNGEGGLPVSDIYRYNTAKQGDKLEISRLTFEMLQIAREMYNDTDGAFNPAVYRLVDLWGFSSRIYTNGLLGQQPYDRTVTAEQFFNNGYPLPEQKYKDAFSAAAFTDFSQQAVELSQEDGKYFVTKRVAPTVVDGVEYQQWLDLGGIAKGYVVDGIKETLEEAGFSRYYVDAGSSSSAFGQSADGGTSMLSIADPFSPYAQIFPEVLLSFEVGKCSVSTSGQYIRKYTTNGVEYAHIMDGATGVPAQTGVKAVLVAVPEDQGLWAGKSDCLTTALTVMGRDKIVNFANGYLKSHNITVVVVFETFDGKKEILSNLDKTSIVEKGETLTDCAWSMNPTEEGTFIYDENVKFDSSVNAYTTLMWVLGVAVCVAVVATVVYYFVKGRKTALQKVGKARKDKPFKTADVGVYLLVLFAIAVLFGVFFGARETTWNTVSVVDLVSGEQLFLYNVSRNEYKVNTQNSEGWEIYVTQEADGITVHLSRQMDGELHHNTVKVVRAAKPTVKMIDSHCGFRQDCVRTYGEITMSGGAIVCSPNHIKVVTQ